MLYPVHVQTQSSAPQGRDRNPLQSGDRACKQVNFTPIREELQEKILISSFSESFKHECCDRSAIDPSLFAATIEIIDDTGFWEPNRALNHQVKTQYQTNRPHEFGAIAMFANEDNSYWQGKPQNPRLNFNKTRAKLKAVIGQNAIGFEANLSNLLQKHPECVVFQKYETPKAEGQRGSRAFLPHIPIEIRRKIGDRHGVEIPEDGSFWDWFYDHPEIPLTVTEGGKKSLALLSQGCVAIALYGVFGGHYTRDVAGNPLLENKLIPEIERFGFGRQVYLAFDQDTNPDTRKKVSGAIFGLSRLLEKAGASVAIAEWDGGDRGQWKGVDDLIVGKGVAAWESAYSEAIPFSHWNIRNRLMVRLKTAPSLQVSIPDLSKMSIDQIPKNGIVAIASAKGTGKTKLMGAIVGGDAAAVSIGHRITLQRGLCKRLGLNYIGDLDKQGGRFVADSAYTLRVGLCVDSVLAIDLGQFRGCDLVLDETVQLVRHLLTSATCAKDGKRPVLLRRFTELVQAARRVILADADLDDAIICYISDLRGDSSKPFLIRNDFVFEGYNCRFIDCSDDSAIVAEFIETIKALPAGKVLFVATNSKGTTTTLQAQIRRIDPTKRILTLNSDTSSGESERQFVESPDTEIINYDVILASPSYGTGGSIESNGVVHKVFGIFSGSSITPDDALQALSRVREPVDRVVWAAQYGKNFSKVSRSTNPAQIKRDLMQSTAVTISLIRSQLRADSIDSWESYNPDTDPHLNIWAKIEADRNRSMLSFRDEIFVKLRHEGTHIAVEQCDRDSSMIAELAIVRRQVREAKAAAIASAQILTLAEALELESKDVRLLEENQALERFHLCEFYCIAPESLTVDDVLNDREGRRRGELLNLEAQLYPEVAIDRTAKSIENQTKWNQGLCPWDISGGELRRKLREILGIGKFLDPDATWTRADLVDFGETARRHRKEIQRILHFSISERMSDVQILGQLLSQLGLKTRSKWRKVNGLKARIYNFVSEIWEESMQILDRRSDKRNQSKSNQDESQNQSPQLAEFVVSECVEYAIAAANSDDFETIEHIKAMLAEVLDGRELERREVWRRLPLEIQQKFRGERSAA